MSFGLIASQSMLLLLALGVLILFGLLWFPLWRSLKSYTPVKPQPIFTLSNPDVIYISDKPPLLGGIPQQIARRHFEEKENITWTNSPVTYPNTLKHLGLFPQHDSRTVDGFKDFVICDIHPSVGKGVFATKHIAQNTIVGIYTGMIELARGPGGHYALDAKTTHSPRIFYDAIRFRNATSYIQHASDAGNAPEIATANVEMQNTLYGTIPLILYVTKQPIEPGEQLLVDYGKNYWKNRAPKAFDRHGKIVENS